jgi:hypothetical protein
MWLMARYLLIRVTAVRPPEASLPQTPSRRRGAAQHRASGGHGLGALVRRDWSRSGADRGHGRRVPQRCLFMLISTQEASMVRVFRLEI